MKKDIYYSLARIKKKCPDALYFLIFGERSNGKTYACLEEILTNYSKDRHSKGAYIRRWREDIIQKRMSVLFDGHVANGLVEKLFKNEGWTNIYYYAGKFYLCRYDDAGNRIKDPEPFCYAFCLSDMEHDKSTSYPDIMTVVFDEMLTRGMYLKNEFTIFMNVLSTIIRDRTGVKIYMLGNTVSKLCPYFDEFGLKHITKMQPGDLDVYEYGDSGLKMAVEFSDTSKKKKKASDLYFAFDNPSLKMIKDGSWETALYPHLLCKYHPSDVVFEFFIQFQDATLHCEVVYMDEKRFIYIHNKTSEIKNDDDLVFTFEDSMKPNYRRNITKPVDKVGRTILDFFYQGLVYYQNNEIGEIVRNYLLQCSYDSLIK